MEQFLSAETIILELLLVVTVVAIAVRRLNIPYTVALVLVGLVLTIQHSITANLTPELILTLFVPPLVFEAALNINLAELRRNLPGVLVLAVPGIVLTTLIVGGLLSLTTPLALPMAMVFGALISATDPVAVVAMFRTVGIPKRLALLVESESLLNDGTAIVMFNLALAIALTGHFSLLESLGDFVYVSIGGVIVGLALGWLVSRLIARVDDYLIETTLTTLLAFGAYLIAERFHFSGVLAVVAAGLVNGNLGSKGMSPTSRIVINNFWEYVAFLANSLVFLLIGLEINLPALLSVWQPVLWAIVAVLLARLVVVYGLGGITNRFTERVPITWLHVLNWGGLRGAIALALVLSLPASLGAERELMKLMAFGVVLFTLLAQSTTMKPLLRHLGLVTHPPEQVKYEKSHARLTAARAAITHLEHRHSEGLISGHSWDQLRPRLTAQVDVLASAMRDVIQSAPQLEAEELDTVKREALRAQRSSLIGLLHDGIISNDVFTELAAEIDTALVSENLSVFTSDPSKKNNTEVSMQYNLKDKVIIITGANSGIGKAAAIQLAQCGARVVIACRSQERGASALKDVRSAANSQSVDLMLVDMSSQKSIRAFVEEFKGKYKSLDVLIHNAANFDHTQKKPVFTEDGQEQVFATNHLGPFLMTNLLMDMLKASAPARIITVASQGLISYPLLNIEFDNLNGEHKFSMQHAYYHSKLAQVMFSFDLAERLRGSGVSVHCVRVGNVAIPNERLAHLPKFLLKLYALKRKFAMTPEKMAETYVWLAADPVGEQQTGGYWDAPNIAVIANKNAYIVNTFAKIS